MHEAIPTTAMPGASANSTPAKGAKRSRRAYFIVLGAVAVLLAVSWVDGGEEPLHTIVETVETPQTGASS